MCVCVCVCVCVYVSKLKIVWCGMWAGQKSVDGCMHVCVW